MKTSKLMISLVLAAGTFLASAASQADGRLVIGVPAPVAAMPGPSYGAPAMATQHWQGGYWTGNQARQVWVPGHWAPVPTAPVYQAPVVYRHHRHHDHGYGHRVHYYGNRSW